MRKISLILLLLALSSCSVIDAGFNYVKDNISITWKGEEAKGEPIDSIVIKFNPIYWKENEAVVSSDNEFEFTDSGYRVWILSTPSNRYCEVLKLDTVIYIYKK